jgi:hypothetical protein
MTDPRRRPRLVSTTAFTLFALGAASEARASCPENVPGNHVFAFAGDDCSASGAYDPTTPIPVPPGNPVALFASGGGTITAPDGVSITLSALDSIGVRASGESSPGDQSTINITGVSIVANSPSSNGVQADAGGVVTLNGGSVTLEAAATDDEGLFATGSHSTISAAGTDIVTHGPGAFGALSQDGGSIVLGGGSVMTMGAGSPGLVALSGSSLSATGTTITTEGGTDLAGVESAGVLIGEAGAAGTLINDTVLTSGSGSDAVLAEEGGNATLGGANSFTTTGDGSIGLHALSGGIINALGQTTISTGSTSGATGSNAYGVNADGAGSQISLGATTVTTFGANAYGFYASNGGSIDAPDAPNITTSGAGAIGLYASGSGSMITTGGASIITNGASATGLQADGGGMATLNGGSVTTAGIDAPAVAASGAGSIVTLNGAAVLSTVGDGSIGLHALSGGIINALGQTTISTGSTSAATGLNAFGVNADGAGSQISLAATTVTTFGTNAHGLYASNGGSIDAPFAPSVTTSGAGAIGLYASGSGSTITAGGASIITNGASATGLQADGGGMATLNGGSVATTGADASAVVASGAGSIVTLNDGSLLSTVGDGSVGLHALGGGVISASGQTAISTSGTNSTATGLNAYGVNADGAGSQINLAAATISTTGAGAAGLYASDALGTGHGGGITVSGPLGVVTGGSSAYGAWAQSAGSTIALNGPSAFTINGGAFGLFASQGGAISTADTMGVVVNGAAAGGVEADGSGSSATLKGSTTIALNGNQNIGLLATGGGAISAQGPTSIAVSGALSTGVQAFSGAVTASGGLNVTTSQASSTAFALRGTAPSIIASGGGTISAAGNAIAFIDAANAVATFDSFNINSLAGDLILADPSTATVNFNHTIANAGAGNLLNATLGSAVAFNANASTLTGAIETDPTSVTNVSFINGTNWTMSGSSTATSLNLANSAIVFSPSGGFKTLTLGSYFGSGANITLNTALGGPNAGSTDQLIVKGGSATGLTSLTIKNASGAAGAATTGPGIPVVVVTSGGTTSATAFHLADNAPILAGGFEYNLDRNSNQDWYLVSSPAATIGQIQNSVTSLAQAQLNQLITTRVLGSLLLGANEQVSGCDCGGGFASIGSFSLGSHGRWALNDSVTLLAGAAFESYYQDGANVRAAPIVAASLRYDPANWGKSRPFFEIGAAASPYVDATYTRYYTNGFTPAQGVGSAVDRSLSVFGRVGWVDRLTPIDEVAVFADLVRGWQQSGGYTEAANALNPFPATVSTGVDRQDVVRVGAQYTHLLFGNIEGNINAAFAYGFDNEFGSRVNVLDFGSVAPFPLLNSAWTEFGGRLGYRFSKNLVVDAFLIGTLGGEIGPTLHGGLGVRYAF